MHVFNWMEEVREAVWQDQRKWLPEWRGSRHTQLRHLIVTLKCWIVNTDDGSKCKLRLASAVSFR